MHKKLPIGQIMDISITAAPLALISSGLLWAVFALLGVLIFEQSVMMSIWGGLLATLLHWLSGVLHQFGHALAARRAGYPMREIQLLHLLTVSIYPRDEPELPAEIHIRRALGGPPASFVLAALGAVIMLILRPMSEFGYLLAAFFFWENLIVYGLSAFLPLGFTDGSTLLEWWPKRGK